MLRFFRDPQTKEFLIAGTGQQYTRANPNMSADEAAAMARRGNADAGPTIFSALQQLGLKVVHTKAPIEVTVIDHVEKPSEN